MNYKGVREGRERRILTQNIGRGKDRKGAGGGTTVDARGLRREGWSPGNCRRSGL